jgi:hypothetical protein
MCDMYTNDGSEHVAHIPWIFELITGVVDPAPGPRYSKDDDHIAQIKELLKSRGQSRTLMCQAGVKMSGADRDHRYHIFTVCGTVQITVQVSRNCYARLVMGRCCKLHGIW